jgi:hypothetical protein
MSSINSRGTESINSTSSHFAVHFGQFIDKTEDEGGFNVDELSIYC